METLIRFFQIFKTFITFVVLEILSLILVSSYNNYQHGQYLNASNALVGSLMEMKENVTGYFGLEDKNRVLARENSRLKTELYAANKALAFFREDSTYAERRRIATENSYKFVTARVISCSLNKSHNYITIDKGELDGIRAEMGVINQSGVVGIVSSTSPHFSLVIPVLNVVSRISAKVKGKSQTGSLVWKGGDYRYASLEEVPAYIPVAKGDSIITSGFSSIFPEGLYVGRIGKCGRGSDNNLRIDVLLGADFSKLNYVDVINFYNADEVKKLEKDQENEEGEEGKTNE